MKIKKEIIYVISIVILILGIISLITLKFNITLSEKNNNNIYDTWHLYMTEQYNGDTLLSKISVSNDKYFTLDKESFTSCFLNSDMEQKCISHKYSLNKNNLTVYFSNDEVNNYIYEIDKDVLSLTYIDGNYTVINKYNRKK